MRAPQIVLVAAAVLQGGYMLFDGIHEIVTGSYFGRRVGPWASVVRALHLRLESMAPVFVVLGALWLLAAVLAIRNSRGAVALAAGLAIVTLAYLPFGTLASLITLWTLILNRRRVRA